MQRQDNMVYKKRNNIKNIKKITNVLNKGYISSKNYDSVKMPFFSIDKNTKFSIGFEKIRELPNRLNRNIINIYKILGDSKKEIYLGEWTIMSLENAMKRYKEICNMGRSNIFDIGYKYEGMGYVTMISCDFEDHLLFYRIDGGSSGYDREYNLNKLIKEGCGTNEKFYFSKWFYNIKFLEEEKIIKYNNNY